MFRRTYPFRILYRNIAALLSLDFRSAILGGGSGGGVVENTGLAHETAAYLFKSLVGESLAVTVYLIVAEYHRKNIELILSEGTAGE